MKVHGTIRYCLHPRTKAKSDRLFGLAGACRFTWPVYIWDGFVAKLRNDYRCFGSCNPYFKSKRKKRGLAGTGKGFVRLHRNTPRLQECSSHVVRGVPSGIEHACKMTVVKASAAYTSQTRGRTCSFCGCVDKENRKSQSEFECRECGHRDNADVNAALNVLTSGNKAAGRGCGDVGRPVKRRIDTKVDADFPNMISCGRNTR